MRRRRRRSADWVRRLPDGLDTQVGSGNLALTPAQAQQVAMTRLVIADPHTLLLDEATSLIDPRTARTLEGSVHALVVDRTVIAIAHRLHTAHDADRIAVVNDGRIMTSWSRGTGSTPDSGAPGPAEPARQATGRQDASCPCRRRVFRRERTLVSTRASFAGGGQTLPGARIRGVTAADAEVSVLPATEWEFLVPRVTRPCLVSHDSQSTIDARTIPPR
ncbi:MAG: hypothetical protein ACR2JG_13400 [Geodermatophilaceae bacterium]